MHFLFVSKRWITKRGSFGGNFYLKIGVFMNIIFQNETKYDTIPSLTVKRNKNGHNASIYRHCGRLMFCDDMCYFLFCAILCCFVFFIIVRMAALDINS